MSKNPQWDYGPELMEPDVFYEKPELFTPTNKELKVITVVGDQEFRHCLMSNPCLMQVAATNPFFNNQVFSLKLIEKAYTSKANTKRAS
ncbi:uncharacterized protein PGTG_21080 [Puccinia graminis f. sp. tritici CRL 75-36-700-3]|uniref:Uncharacterized protein n=1 Tax=Puccinia graminis f. sp. tritici (strain CRL 75-36-700-3 / race SCCL) TaxID=418459 RepID=H6QQC0_PUCGT|nr:uncharacterized protein PGTG_21080 [Puccinia graminis f. sp. tritici CRL 75-36-700-3]EHS62531.1 hypothetical protein PGTG_21080 [Puccinia graminis f. sp. tritici CRL 75-36-700-3]